MGACQRRGGAAGLTPRPQLKQRQRKYRKITKLPPHPVPAGWGTFSDHLMTTKTDPHNLERFVQAQEQTYHQALAEIRAGEKVTHWIWFVFPRLAGDGYSPMSEYYAIKNREEAEAYLRHPILGPRLLECVRAVLDCENKTLLEIFGEIDEAKVHQCASLFASLPGADPAFAELLKKS